MPVSSRPFVECNFQRTLEPSMSAATSLLELTAWDSLRPISTHPEPFQTSIS